MTNREKLLKAADTCQRDVLYALADEAEDAGDEALSAGYRWLADKGKWPCKLSSGWIWTLHADGFFSSTALHKEFGLSPGAPFGSASLALSAAAEAVGEALRDGRLTE